MKERPKLKNPNILYAKTLNKDLDVSCKCPYCSGQFTINFSHALPKCSHCEKLLFWDDLLTPEHLDSLNMALSYKNRESDKESPHD